MTLASLVALRSHIKLLHTWLAATETPKTFIRSCLVDFSKAFDTISHNILISKLRLLNVPPILLNWCASFLRNRQQRVKVQNVKSGWNLINGGVPQGTKLGPLFFLVMINDLTTTVPMYTFFDDVTMSEIISLHPNHEAKITIASTSYHLQDEINAVTRWTSTNNMKFNEKKTKGIYRFLFEESTTITASDNCQQPTPRESQQNQTAWRTSILRSQMAHLY